MRENIAFTKQLSCNLVFLFTLFLLLRENFVMANTFVSQEDGNWEDSIWNGNQSLEETLDGDTVIINHHVTFNGTLNLTHCFLQINYDASLCGYDSVNLFFSRLLEYGGFFAQYVLVKSSHWESYSGYYVVLTHILVSGPGSEQFVCCGAGGHGGEGFICSNPVQYWQDSTFTDSSANPRPPTFRIYPNPSSGNIIVVSNVPPTEFPIILDIYDVVGRAIQSTIIPDGKSSLSFLTNAWTPGVYLFNFKRDGIVLKTIRVVRVP